MTFPQEINTALIEFLNLIHHHSKFDATVRMESYATTVFQLYDTCTTVLQQMVHKYDQNRIPSIKTPIPSFDDLIKSAIREELNHGYCNGDLLSAVVSNDQNSHSISRFQWDDTLIDIADGTIINRMTSSPTTEMIRTIFVENSLRNVCHQSPNTRLCRNE